MMILKEKVMERIDLILTKDCPYEFIKLCYPYNLIDGKYYNDENVLNNKQLTPIDELVYPKGLIK